MITVVSIQGDKYYLAEAPTAFEDGTLDYLNIPAVKVELRHIRSIGYETIHERVHCLTGWLLDNPTAMQYTNGNPLVRIYGLLAMEQRGGAVALNSYDTDGNPIDHRRIEADANKVNISLRTGCFYNPGVGELALGISKPELTACFSQPGHERLSYGDFCLCIDGKASGAGWVNAIIVRAGPRAKAQPPVGIQNDGGKVGEITCKGEIK